MPFAQQNSLFIDPEECGSSVGYHLHVSDYTDSNNKTVHRVEGTVVMTDCRYRVDWDFSGNKLEKIDNAIRILMEFRKKLWETSKLVEKLNK